MQSRMTYLKYTGIRKNTHHFETFATMEWLIAIIQGAEQMNTTFFQQGGDLPHKANAVLNVLHDVFGIPLLLNRFTKRLGCGWSWPPCSPDIIPEIISFATSGSGNWSCCWRDHRWRVAWQSWYNFVVRL